MNSFTFPDLETERLTLRQPAHDDGKAVFFLRTDKEVNQHIKRPAPANLEDALAFIDRVNGSSDERKSYYWAITLKNSAEMLGSISLWNFSEDRKVAEVGYDLHPKMHGKGIMSEAINQVLDYAFNTLRFQEVEAYTQHQNSSSVKMLKKNSFQLMEGKKDKDNPDNIVLNILESDFNQK